MISRRRASLIAPQFAISSSVRPQPVQRPVLASIAQTSMQGDETGGEAFILFRGSMAAAGRV